MLSRLYPLYKDTPLTYNRLTMIILVQLFFLIALEINLTLFLLFAILVLLNVLEFFIEKKSSPLNRIRFMFFVLLFIISLIFSLGTCLDFNYGILFLLQDLFKDFNPAINLKTPGLNFVIIITGLLFLLNESNFLIRLIFELTGKIPVKKESTEPDQSELNAGRVIGILERLIIFFFVTIGQFAAVGFVIATKGIVRYKELEDRNFAEYVLIGTLLSSLIAIIAGFAVARLLI
jgi:hypothetical protein